ncbi:MAG: cytochrome c [Afipia sp.]|nr:cytochrome c [Afipia sp.]
MKRWIVATLIMLLALGGGVFLFVFTGAFNVAADEPHWEVTRRLLEVVRDRSIEVRSRNIEVPNLQDDQLVLKGAGQYAAMCANCHLAPGKPGSEIRPGLYPKPPKLAEHPFNPKETFWVIKHGLKMTGMPAWGLGHDDATLWSIVAFVGKLPGMSAQQYEDIVAKAPPDEEMQSMDRDGSHGHEHRDAHGTAEPATPKPNNR